MLEQTTRVRQSRKAGAETTTHEQLLDAAGGLMIERGTTDISLSDIAQRSGLNSALVKYYFGNKAGMLLALLRRAMQPGLNQLSDLISSRRSPSDKLRIHISGMVSTYFRYPYVNRLLHQMVSAEDSVSARIVADEFAHPVADAQRAILEEGVRLGEFRAVDPMLFHFHVTGACDMLFYQRSTLHNVFHIERVDDDLRRRYVDHLCDMVMTGLRP